LPPIPVLESGQINSPTCPPRRGGKNKKQTGKAELI